MRPFFAFLCILCTLEATPPPLEKEPKRFLRTPIENVFSLDVPMSSHAGARTLLFLHKGIEALEVNFLSRNDFFYQKGLLPTTLRAAELIGFWFPFNYFTITVQHEIFGHGSEIRQLSLRGKAGVDKYHFNMPPFYGPGGAYTSFFFDSKNLSLTEYLTIGIGGVESTQVMAHEIRKNWMLSKTLDPRQIFLYLFAARDLYDYIDSLKFYPENCEGHDIQGYLLDLKDLYPDRPLTRHTLDKMTLLSYLDPFYLLLFPATFYYLRSGDAIPLPMIASCYLPSVHLSLTPFGPECVLENYLLVKDQLIHFYLKHGSHAKNRYAGLGVSLFDFFQLGNWQLGGSLHLWHQPKLLLQAGSVSLEEFFDADRNTSTGEPLYSDKDRHSKRLGMALFISFLYDRKTRKTGLELGYKSKGYLSGYPLRASPIFRANWSLEF